jgi:uncharacterized membrane protein
MIAGLPRDSPILLVLLLAVILEWMMPGLTRANLFFGVTVPDGTRETPEARRIVRSYRLAVGCLGGALILTLAAAGALLPSTGWATWLGALGAVMGLLLLALPYLWAHRASMALARAVESSTASAGPLPAASLRPRRYSDFVPWLWELLPLSLVAATATFLVSRYGSAPSVIPIHFDARGTANGFMPRSIGSYFGLVWVQLSLEVVLTGVAVLAAGARGAPGPADRRFRRIWLRALFGLKVLLLAFLGVLAAGIAGAEPPAEVQLTWLMPLTLGFTGVVLLGGLALALYTGQGGARLGEPRETGSDRTADRYWKLGVIYVNREDPSLFVEKRFGVGWTVNLGNPLALAVLVGAAVLVSVPTLIALANRIS